MDTASSSVNSRGLLRLAVVIAALPLGMLLLAALLILSPPYQRYTDEDWITGAHDLYTASNRQCDILIYGDSTAMVGIDPRIVTERTHMKACNIAPSMNSIKLVGTVPLDRYLARNPRPRYLFLQFLPSNMHPHPDPEDKRVGFDGYLPMLRYGYAAQGVRQILMSPDVLIGMMHYAYINAFINFRERRKGHASTLQPGAGSYMILPEPPLSQCPNQEYFPLGERSTVWAEQTRAHYAPMAGQLIFDAAPTFPCNHVVAQWIRTLSGLIDNTIEVYPTGEFVDGSNHPTREGSIRRSNEIADQILALENKARSASAEGNR